MEVSKNDYEAEREARIAQNRKRMQEIGIQQTVAEMTQTNRSSILVPLRPAKRKMERTLEGPVRRSGRLQGCQPQSMDEDEMFCRSFGIDALDLLAPMRRRRSPVNPSSLAALRAKRVGKCKHDSGLGVRLQGGRVYDSQYGITCHWCRQKTLENHAVCTHPQCGGSNRLPVSFCQMCLRNRHGEDVAHAIASECWICPVCRGSCGDGCISCCNCGPCRKKAGLAPTHQIIKEARSAGIGNVHDYLVYRNTKESSEIISARKTAHSWGQWLTKPFCPPDDGVLTPLPDEEYATRKDNKSSDVETTTHKDSEEEEDSHAVETRDQVISKASHAGNGLGRRALRHRTFPLMGTARS